MENEWDLMGTWLTIENEIQTFRFDTRPDKIMVINQWTRSNRLISNLRAASLGKSISILLECSLKTSFFFRQICSKCNERGKKSDQWERKKSVLNQFNAFDMFIVHFGIISHEKPWSLQNTNPKCSAAPLILIGLLNFLNFQLKHLDVHQNWA